MGELLQRVAYALRREGVQVLRIKDGRFPTMIILNPSERIIKKSVEVRVNNNGQRMTKYVANEQGVSLYW
ncbi:hypothetical protein [Pasteurella multocida]|uniref:hypothetical protein n=1 Tax=Pasteurella multocida TaxID=747 RepID=UPI0007EC545B|nr:hypothetical protein [Pasteurella multocida]MCL7839130.1 hypothetical protein [Pasteurella multocida]OBP35171.1 hypothetical protein A0R69_04095 [Pasteurella multocida subsp. multocida]PNM03703.1 hypothetical protein A6J89_007845 [Pasteurella multocida]PNM09896.1 hypothetical protein A6J59_004180 [Pasteurella multocida]URH92490.1 hypothetical protein M8853_02680 [Pasteurella multocida]